MYLRHTVGWYERRILHVITTYGWLVRETDTTCTYDIRLAGTRDGYYMYLRHTVGWCERQGVYMCVRDTSGGLLSLVTHTVFVTLLSNSYSLNSRVCSPNKNTTGVLCGSGGCMCRFQQAWRVLCCFSWVGCLCILFNFGTLLREVR